MDPAAELAVPIEEAAGERPYILSTEVRYIRRTKPWAARCDPAYVPAEEISTKAGQVQMKANKSVIAIIVLLAVLLGILAVLAHFDHQLTAIQSQLPARAPSASPLQTVPAKPERVAHGQTVYVPVYSHVYSGFGREQALEATLSIRNTDLEHAIVVSAIRYYDNEGTLLRDYLDAPVLLGPLASADFLVERRDMAGGVGANFLVEWVAEEVVTTPVIEAVMVSSEGNKAFAFVRPGYPIATTRGDEGSE